MALAGGLGALVRLTSVPFEGPTVSDRALLYSESTGRFLVEVAPPDAAAFEEATRGLPRARIGETTEKREVAVLGLRSAPLLAAPLDGLRDAFLRRLPL